METRQDSRDYSILYRVITLNTFIFFHVKSSLAKHFKSYDNCLNT